MTNPLVAGNVAAPVDSWAGVWIAEDVQTIAHGVRDGSWIEAGLGGVSAGLDALTLVSDPIGALLQFGVAWIIEHVEPLSETLDWLAGNPDQIAAHAQTWRNVAGAVRGCAADLDRAERWDTAEWTGSAADAYRAWASQQRGAVEGLAAAAETMAVVTQAAGALIAGVRMMVRDAIATLVSRLVTYAAEAVFTLGLATPLVVERVATLCASWAARIARWLKDLIASLARLRDVVAKITQAVEALKKLLGRLRRSVDEPSVLDRVRKRGAGPQQLYSLASVRRIAAKYGIDISPLDISLGDKVRRGTCGHTRPDGRIVLFVPGFRSEEDLARTLAHEKVHHDELAEGKQFPSNAVELDEWEDRAYAYEDAWWDNQSVRPEPRKR